MTPIDEIRKMATVILQSGMFGNEAKRPKVESVMTCMMIAEADGHHPAAGARDYRIIGGSPCKKAEAMLRDFNIQGGKIKWVQSDNSVCTARFYQDAASHKAGEGIEVTWDLARVKQAGITNPLYKTYPAQLLRSRTIAEGCRATLPGSTGGTYTPEEQLDMPETAERLRTEAGGPEVAVLDAAREAACAGTEVFEKHWAGLKEEQRAQLADYFEELSALLLKADTSNAAAKAGVQGAKPPVSTAP